jgi:hypothetical protein
VAAGSRGGGFYFWYKTRGVPFLKNIFMDLRKKSASRMP